MDKLTREIDKECLHSKITDFIIVECEEFDWWKTKYSPTAALAIKTVDSSTEILSLEQLQR